MGEISYIGLGVIIFSLINIGISIWSYFKVKGKAVNYFKAGAVMPVWVVGISLIAPSIDANGSIGAAARSADLGFWAGASIPVGLALCMFLLGKYFARPIWQMNLMTLSDFYGRRYNKTVERLATLFMLIGGCILLAGNFAGLSFLLSRVFPVEFLPVLILVGFYVVTYSLTGGFITSLSTSIFQVLIFVIAIILTFCFLTFNHGWVDLMKAVPETHKMTIGLTEISFGALDNWAAIISLSLGNVVALDLIQRIISSESPEAAQRSCYVGGVMTLLFATPVSIIGLYSFYLNQSADFTLLTNIAIDNLPQWIGVLLMVGVIAASIAVASGVLLALSNAVTRNLIQRSIHIQWDNSKLLRTSRVIAIPILIISMTFAYFRPEPGTLLILAFDIILAACLVPFIFGIYWNKSNTPSAIVAILTGASTRVILHLILPPSLSGLDTILPPICSALVFVLVALKTQKISSPKNVEINRPLSEQELLTGQF